MGSPWLFILLVLAVFRVTRLLTLDTWPPAAKFRRWLEKKIDPKSPWSELASCPFCAGAWISLFAVLSAWGTGYLNVEWFMLLVWWWAVAGAQATLASIGEGLA